MWCQSYYKKYLSNQCVIHLEFTQCHILDRLALTINTQFSLVQLLSCVRLVSDHMDCSRPGLPVHHQLPEHAQTHVQWVGDAIQPYPLSSPSLPIPFFSFNLSQHQRLFQWVTSSHRVAKVLDLQLQHQSFQ